MRKKCIHANQPKRGPYPNNPNLIFQEFKFRDEAARLKSLMRHPWYRQKLIKEALAAQG